MRDRELRVLQRFVCSSRWNRKDINGLQLEDAPGRGGRAETPGNKLAGFCLRGFGVRAPEETFRYYTFNWLYSIENKDPTRGNVFCSGRSPPRQF
ncbi:hypothetical protein SLA2020_453620 [Shorea laevis]